MNDKIFLDTNILIYCYSFTEPVKQSKAQSVVNSSNTIISTQVLKEFANILYKKFKLSWDEIDDAIHETTDNFEVHINTPTSIRRACVIADQYGFSFYDSLIITAALESNCHKLYSEDMQSGQIIEQTLTIENPLL